MKNINHYANIAAFNADTNRPTNESTASSINDGTGVVFAGRNILVDKAGAGVCHELHIRSASERLKIKK